MAAKEPTVERRHRLLALQSMHPDVHELTWWAHKWIEGAEQFDTGMTMRVAQALAAAEQAAAERAWDEGYADGFSHHSKANPYRLPKGPTK